VGEGLASHERRVLTYCAARYKNYADFSGHVLYIRHGDHLKPVSFFPLLELVWL